MEIERKFLIKKLPDNIKNYPFHIIEQAYLCTDPVVRVRREDDRYYMTYKGKGLLAREEANLPLNQSAYEHLKEKADGNIICKTRYLIPDPDGVHIIELDVFEKSFAPLILAEVEFESLEAANTYRMPDWFQEDVTDQPAYHNSNMSRQKRL